MSRCVGCTPGTGGGSSPLLQPVPCPSHPPRGHQGTVLHHFVPLPGHSSLLLQQDGADRPAAIRATAPSQVLVWLGGRSCQALVCPGLQLSACQLWLGTAGAEQRARALCYIGGWVPHEIGRSLHRTRRPFAGVSGTRNRYCPEPEGVEPPRGTGAAGPRWPSAEVASRAPGGFGVTSLQRWHPAVDRRCVLVPSVLPLGCALAAGPLARAGSQLLGTGQ